MVTGLENIKNKSTEIRVPLQLISSSPKGQFGTPSHINPAAIQTFPRHDTKPGAQVTAVQQINL